MALLDFLKKKSVAAAEYPEQSFMPQPSSMPVEQVMIMRQQGASNPQIIQTLQRNYSPQQIADAMAQAEARLAGEPFAGMPAQEQFAPAVQQPSSQNVTEEVESQINEKWRALSDELKPLSEWKEHVDSQIGSLANDVNALKSEVEKIHKAVFAQIQEYGQNLRDVGAEIKAIEKVFTQVLPELTTSVQDISRAAKQLKGNEKPEKSKK
ncbi:hypothetical protein HY485_05500 [Candidatus Woesearchaeota archaeon]|nr:hypothetical protein [Candidatus Woesearchaeota archaeon]